MYVENVVTQVNVMSFLLLQFSLLKHEHQVPLHHEVLLQLFALFMGLHLHVNVGGEGSSSYSSDKHSCGSNKSH
jgi:hypothetical protein